MMGKEANFNFERWLGKAGRFEREEVSWSFLQKLEELSRSGLPPGEAIRIMATRIREPKMQGIAQRCWKDLREGKSLSQSMRGLSRIFDASVLAILEVGEATGNLANVLINARELLESRIQLRKEFIARMAYPTAMVFVVALVFLFGLFYMVPMVEGMMKNMGASLSWSIQLLLGGARVAVYLVPIGAVGLVVSILWIWKWRTTEEGRYRTDEFFLKIPVYRDIAINTEICRLTSLAAILFRNGVETTEILRLMERSLHNAVLQKRLHQARQMIKEGSSFSAALSRTGLLPDIDADVLGIGENTGNLAESFQNIYQVRQIRLRESLARLTSVIAYGTIMLVFVMIFLLAYGMVVSMLQLNERVLRR
jgi:type II secretory pathway component PulF